MRRILLSLLALIWITAPCFAKPVLDFKNASAVRFEKKLKVGQAEILEFDKPVSLAHYGTNSRSMNYIDLEKLSPSKNGYKKFMVKAKSPGTGELTFQSGTDLVKVYIVVENDYENLEHEINSLFGLKDANADEYLRVIPANAVVSNGDAEYIYLKGTVASPKDAMLALSYAANAVGDHGVKIYSNPGGQLRSEKIDGLDNKNEQGLKLGVDDSSFVEFYESTNKLIDTNNLHRDLVLASNNERVISYIKIQEPKRFAIKVRFLEMDARYVDDYMQALSVSGVDSRISGAIGLSELGSPSFNAFGDLSSSLIRGAGGNFISGVANFGDITAKLTLRDLLQEGVLRVVNEFSLVAHSGESVSLGKGTRFPIPRTNNNLGGNNVSIEYIPIGFKGELKVTGLDDELIDVQLASRLSTPEATANTFEGFAIPIFKEEYVNSGAMVASGQEVVLNSFLTEIEQVTKSKSGLGRLIPFIGNAKKKRKNKNLLFIALQATEIDPVGKTKSRPVDLPHLDLNQDRSIFNHAIRDLQAKKMNTNLDIAELFQAKVSSALPKSNEIDALDLGSGIEALPGVE